MRVLPSPALLVPLALGALVALPGCEEYVEPPLVDLDFPPEGTFIEGDSLALTFTEAIEPETLKVRVWRDQRNIEGEMPPDAVPLLDVCTVDTSPCDDQGSAVRVADDGMTAEIVLDPEGIGKPDVPLLVEVLAGLRSVETGADLGSARIFDFQFKPAVVQEDPVPFEEGIYLFVSVFDEPIPNVITLMSDVRVTADGRFYIVGAESDEIAGAAQNTRDPEELFIDDTDQGFVVFAVGRIRENDRGERFMETETFEIQLRLLEDLIIQILGLRFTGIVVKNEDTGLDQIQGTLSFEGITLRRGENPPFTYAAGTTTFVADQVPAEHVPEGTPDMCENPCGIVPGQCEPPSPWPPEGVCDDGEGSGEGALEGSGEGS